MIKVILIIGRIKCKFFFRLKYMVLIIKLYDFYFFYMNVKDVNFIVYRFNNLCSWLFLVIVLDLYNFIKLMYL